MTMRINDIIRVALLERGITRYRVMELISEGWQLPGSAGDDELEAASGLVVAPEHAYRFWVGWADGHYTLGEEDGNWREVLPERDQTEDWQEIRHIQQQMRVDPAFGAPEPMLPSRGAPDKPTARELFIIQCWLAPRFFDAYDLTHYDGPLFELLAVQPGDHDLVGSLAPGEVRAISGMVVVHQGAYHFRLTWVWSPTNDLHHHHPGHYSLGEADGSWRPVSRAECSKKQWQQVQVAQQRLEQAFARLPRWELPWLDRAADDTSPAIAPPHAGTPRSERKPRVLRDLSKNTEATDKP